MLKARNWFSSLLVLAIMAVPAMAGNNDAKTANDNAASTASAEASPAATSPNPSPSPSLTSTTAASDSNVTALLGVLVMKGVLAPGEANAIRNAAPAAQFQALVEVLSRKGVLSAADLSAATSPAAQPPAPAAVPETAVSSSLEILETQASSQMAPAPKPAVPAVVPAVAPVRVLPVDPPKTGGLVGLKVGPITFAPYGFLKATAVHDTSDPDGDDFPFIGLFFNSTAITNTGPNGSPGFHLKARSSRIGANFEWPDISPKLTVTGRVEADFESNFSVVDNADASSIRNPSPRLRLAWVRTDYHVNDRTDIFFKGGQDWSLFGSAALPNLLETTFLGAFYGDIYTRSPQFTFGLVQSLGSSSRNFKLLPEFGIMMPSTGDIMKLQDIPSPSNTTTFLSAAGLNNQLGQGEDEGALANRPEVEGRVALQFQLDPAPGVAPAQVFISGFQSRREAITTSSNGPAPLATQTTVNGVTVQGSVAVPEPASYLAAFPNGFTASSNMYGGQIAAQLPTRWFTLVASAYRGADLRFYAGGQFNTYAADVTGLSNPITFTTTDGGPFITDGVNMLGCTGTFTAATGACSGSVAVAPQRPIRSFGGFVNLGLPLSRWFNANPKGHNAGWQLLFDVGKDQVVNRDLNNKNFVGIVSPLPLLMGKMFAATLYYKFNNWCSFGFEQSNYATRLLDRVPGYVIGTNSDGTPKASNEWKDQRTEFGPIFTF